MIKKRTGKRILLIEDDRTLSRLLAEQLTAMGHEVATAQRWGEAKSALISIDPSLAILDIRLPDADGIQCLPELAAECPVIVLTAYGTIKDAVKAMRAGAIEYLVKPVNPAELDLAVCRAIETTSLRRSNEYFRNQLRPGIRELMVGESQAFRKLVRMIELVAPGDTTVLVQGETGVGKELVARSIHQLSPRAERNFVPVDCCTLQENLFESELFGHEKGAFTGADRRKLGLIEIAEGGTVFIDEIGEISPVLQAKLLRVLETGEFRRLGGTQTLSSDARFVVATNRDLKQLSEGARFRFDLYYRLAAVVITVPTLRERREDIPVLADHFLQTRTFLRQATKRFGRDSFQALTEHSWPGNIRELRNVVERAVLISGEQTTIRAHHLGIPLVRQRQLSVELRFDHEPTLDEVKQAYLAQLLAQHHGHRAKIASILGISERNTYRLIKKIGLMEEQPGAGEAGDNLSPQNGHS
jgi:DNA-binding NtrC family response regulator